MDLEWITLLIELGVYLERKCLRKEMLRTKSCILVRDPLLSISASGTHHTGIYKCRYRRQKTKTPECLNREWGLVSMYHRSLFVPSHLNEKFLSYEYCVSYNILNFSHNDNELTHFFPHLEFQIAFYLSFRVTLVVSNFWFWGQWLLGLDRLNSIMQEKSIS